MFFFLNFQECVVVRSIWLTLICIVLCMFADDVQVFLVAHNTRVHVVDAAWTVSVWTLMPIPIVWVCLVSMHSLFWYINFLCLRLDVEISFYVLVLANKHDWSYSIVAFS